MKPFGLRGVSFSRTRASGNASAKTLGERRSPFQRTTPPFGGRCALRSAASTSYCLIPRNHAIPITRISPRHHAGAISGLRPRSAPQDPIRNKLTVLGVETPVRQGVRSAHTGCM